MDTMLPHYIQSAHFLLLFAFFFPPLLTTLMGKVSKHHVMLGAMRSIKFSVGTVGKFTYYRGWMEVIFSLTGALFKAGKEGVICRAGGGEEGRTKKEERRKEGRKGGGVTTSH
ncbi:hypothetical protein B9Z19DRAFT_230039 [Tuber borchii]|uniref:Uncharacterized protein n=1 Tax=Tuber borchii TaxID=42251 RepID=A0A2T6ZMK9_TUBBO|nr:hypothetical protein B9Z19DRAFT_230039 [Tuber borchii]